jgi:hypothetical protein
VSKGYNRSFSAITKSASIILLFFVTNLLNIPATFQDMVIHMVTTTSIGYTILLHMELFGIFPLLVVGPFMVICILVHFMIQSGRASAQMRLAKLMPAPVETKDNKYNKQKEEEEDRFPVDNYTAPQFTKYDKNAYRTRRQSVQAGISTLRHLVNRSDEDEDSSFDSDCLSEFTISDQDEELLEGNAEQSQRYYALERNPVVVKNMTASIRDEGFANYSKHLNDLSNTGVRNSKKELHDQRQIRFTEQCQQQGAETNTALHTDMVENGMHTTHLFIYSLCNY